MTFRAGEDGTADDENEDVPVLAEQDAAAASSDCAHDRIRHEHRTLSVCVGCGVQMLRHAGDWRAKS